MTNPEVEGLRARLSENQKWLTKLLGDNALLKMQLKELRELYSKTSRRLGKNRAALRVLSLEEANALRDQAELLATRKAYLKMINGRKRHVQNRKQGLQRVANERQHKLIEVGVN